MHCCRSGNSGIASDVRLGRQCSVRHRIRHRRLHRVARRPHLHRPIEPAPTGRRRSQPAPIADRVVSDRQAPGTVETGEPAGPGLRCSSGPAGSATRRPGRCTADRRERRSTGRVRRGAAGLSAEDERFSWRTPGKRAGAVHRVERPEQTRRWRLASAGLRPRNPDEIGYSLDLAVGKPEGRLSVSRTVSTVHTRLRSG